MTGFTVDESAVGERLDVTLAAHLELSRSQAVGRIIAGDVLVDGQPAAKQHRLRLGERVEVAEQSPQELSAPPPMPPVRYRDEHLLIVAKPPGLVVHPGPGHADDTLVQALQAADIPLALGGDDDRPGIVHRLDRDTSGLLVVASTDAAREGLIEALSQRRIARRYLALVIGEPTEPRGRIEAPIGRDPDSRRRFGVVAGGKAAVTRYVNVATGLAPGGVPADPGTPVTLIVCTLETGRTHQIRVHLTALGHPVVGDPTYGARKGVAAALGADRPMLHAAELRFDHPVTGELIEVEEPAPDDLRAACEVAGIDLAERLPAAT